MAKNCEKIIAHPSAASRQGSGRRRHAITAQGEVKNLSGEFWQRKGSQPRQCGAA